MNSKHLETFAAVLRNGTLLATARALGCAQSTVTVRIQEFERELGTRLFRRAGRRLMLTEAGEAVSQRTVQVADAIDSLKDLAASYGMGRSGRVRIAAIEPTATHRLPRVVAALCRQKPGLQVALEVASSDRVASFVAENEVDFALTSPPPAELRLEFDPWFSEELALLVPARHPLARRSRLTAADLRRADLMLTDKSCAYRSLIERRLHALGIRPANTMEVGSFSTLGQLVAEGLGVAIVPICGSRPPLRGTVLKRIRRPRLSLPLGLVTRPAGHAFSPVLADVIAVLRRHLAR